MFQFYSFDRRHSNYKTKKLILRSNFDVSDIKTPPIKIVSLQFFNEKLQVWVLVGERLIKC